MSPFFTALVVETNYLVASAIEDPLTDSGYRVIVATNDDEAAEALADQSIDVAIIDFRLQHGDAGGLVARLSAAAVPYIFCTAASSEEVVESFPGARVIEKPFPDEALLSLVDQVVRNALVRPDV